MQKLLSSGLDETLIFATTEPINRTADFMVGGQYHIHKRPHLREFLDYCFTSFLVAVWTSMNSCC